MKIIVVGSGKIGSIIVEQLAAEGHDVTAVDTNEKKLADMQNRVDVLGVLGNGIMQDVQLEAGVDKADLLIAVTAGDEVNLLCCLMAKKLGAKSTIARVREPGMADQLLLISGELGLSLSINPELSVAQEIFTVLRFPGIMSVDRFAQGRLNLAEFRLGNDNVMTTDTLNNLSRKYKSRALVCAVRREKETIIPNGEFQLQPNDMVSFVADAVEGERFMQLAGIPERMPRDVMIIGAGRITYYLVRMMLKAGMRPVVVEHDQEKSVAFSDAFPHVLVIQGDGTDRALLEEEGIRNMDAFVSLTGTDEVNILLSMYAQSQNVTKVVTKVSQPAMVDLVQDSNIGSVISPREVAANRVLSYVRAMGNAEDSNVDTLYRIVDGTAEALEFRVKKKDSDLIGIPLKDLKLKKNLLICGIFRKGRAIIPGGMDTIELEDQVVVVTTVKRMNHLHEILE